MSELGLQLKQAREEQKLSLEDLQRTTKIQKRYLLAIEEGRFDSLPGIFYARAFVKTYAEAVGLDANELLAQHKNELPQPSKNAESIPSRSERLKPVPEPPNRQSRTSAVVPVLAGVLFLVVIAVVIWLVTSQLSGNNDRVINEEEPSFDADFNEESPSQDESANEEDQATEEEGTNTDENTATNEEEEEQEEEQTSELTLNDSSGNTSFLELDASEFQLAIEFTGACSVDIRDADGNFLVSPSTLDADSEISEDFSDQEKVLINLGASQNAIVTINGEEVDMPLDTIHQKLEISFTP